MGIYDRDWYRKKPSRFGGWWHELDTVGKVFVLIFVACIVGLVLMKFLPKRHPELPDYEAMLSRHFGDSFGHPVEDRGMHDLIERGDTAQAQMLLVRDPGQAWAALDLGNPDLPIHHAARKGNVQLVTHLLVYHGLMAPDVRDGHGATPLHHAARHGKFRVAKILLDREADPDAEDNDHLTPLMLAARGSESRAADVAELLLKHDARLDLHSALCLGKVGQARELLQKDPEAVQRDPLRDALLTDTVQMLRRKVRQAAAKGGEPAARHAERVIGEHRDLVETLIARGADVNKGGAGPPPLAAAVQMEHPALARLLLEKGADPRADAGNGKTILQLAQESPAGPEMAELLRKHVAGR